MQPIKLTMDSRREFIKKASLLSGAAGIFQALPASIQRAIAIDPQAGTTFLDAEHVVILMQENRSFDHCYGTLQGVRGFNDPRVMRQPDNNVAWIQKNTAGEAYTPFRLNIKETNATFLGSLPHSWTNQVDARNDGKYDQWLTAKPSGHKGMEQAPLTLGYYNREDIPFYYSLADAFTVCDQNFCSSLTGTTPNRLYLWTGTIREKQLADSTANVFNSDVDYDKEASWKTFPERLEENNISWKIYQNEISLESGFTSEEDDWLGNFTDNPIEWFSRYHVRFSPGYKNYLDKIAATLPAEILSLEEKLKNLPEAEEETKKLQRQLKYKKNLQERVNERHKWSEENFKKLSATEQQLHKKAFTINSNDAHYRELTSLQYTDNGVEREMKVPKGDVLHQFRKDVAEGNLPAVSWVVGPSNFSDHPGSPWYGAWYVSEVMDILTKKPEVWQKTIFILCYDENDGYFDHVPPFVPPHPQQPETGKVSKGIDTSVEYVLKEQELNYRKPEDVRESPIGLGYRVPLVIASPWSRGGAVCSQVFDHTSILQFLEKFLSHKTGKKIEETNISAWRRAVCGDLTTVFKPYNGEKIAMPAFVTRDTFYESIHKAQFKKEPSGFRKLTAEEIKQLNAKPVTSSHMPRQEKGMRTACPLPYQLYADGHLNAAANVFEIKLAASNEVFGKQAAGSPFTVYAQVNNDLQIRHYAVVPGDELKDSWTIKAAANNSYHFRINGPNGFYRELRGTMNDPNVNIQCDYARRKINGQKLNGDIEIHLINSGQATCTVEIADNAYTNGKQTKQLSAKGNAKIVLDLSNSFGWYDFTVRIAGNTQFEKRYAGHVETGELSKTDPQMANA
jgi:phospholipase C